MSITVNTNMQALKIQQNLSSATAKMNTAMERMSSGFRINSASDDAAGYAVSSRLTTTISSSKVASDNVAIAKNLLDTAEGNLDTISSNLSRIRDLTEEASNGTYSTEDLKAIASEVSQRVAEIDRSAKAATFNDISLFDDATTGKNGISIQVGTQSTDTLTLDSSIFKSATVSSIGLFKATAGGDLQVETSTPGTYQTVYDSTGATLKASQMSTAITAIFTGAAYTDAGHTTKYSVSNFLNDVDSAMSDITTRTTKIGASDNRLSSISDTLTTQQTNLTAAKSTIKDADTAEESASYVQSQILQSASATLLTQANSAPQIALQLIKG